MIGITVGPNKAHDIQPDCFASLFRVCTFPVTFCIYIEFTSFLMIKDVSSQNANITLQVARSLGNQNTVDCVQH